MTNRTRILSVACILAAVVCWPTAGANGRDATTIDKKAPALPAKLSGYDPSGQIRFATARQADERRQELIRWIWPGGLPIRVLPTVTSGIDPAVFSGDLAGLDGSLAASVDRLDADIAPYDFHATMYLVHPRTTNGNSRRLVIINSGHRLKVMYTLGTEDSANRFLKAGFQVLMTDMPLIGFNTDRTVVLPEGKGTVTIAKRDHNDMFKKLTPPVLREGEIYRFFLEPFVQGINHFYDSNAGAADVSFVGLSGGGWSSHMIAAVDTRIKSSFAVAGSLPLYARPFAYAARGDAEQYYAPLYREIDSDGDKLPDRAAGVASWLEIYALGGYGPGRQQIQVLCPYDRNFGGTTYKTYAKFVSGVVKKLGQGKWEFHEDTTHNSHLISPDVLNHVILPAIGGVSPTTLSEALLSNPGFETGAPANPIFDRFVPNWRRSGNFDSTEAGCWRGTDKGFPAFIGHGAGALNRVHKGERAWLFQYLGTVAHGDEGKTFRLSADFGGRAAAGKRSKARLTVAFRSGTTPRLDPGTVLGSAGSVDLTSGTEPIELTTSTATWTPTAADIGTEVFAVLSLDVLANIDGSHSAKQYMADNVTLDVGAARPPAPAESRPSASGPGPFFEMRGWETMVDGLWFDSRAHANWYKSKRYLDYLDLVLDRAPEFNANALIFMGRSSNAEPHTFISYRAWPKLNAIYEERGKGDRELQCKRLNEIIAKGKRRGVGIYLWAHELYLPRELIKLHPGMKGVRSSFCPSSPEFLEFVSSKYDELYDRLPGLAGTFLVLSETQTSLLRGSPCKCARCAKLKPAQVVEGLIRAVQKPAAARNKKLVVRLFAHDPEEIARICDAINSMPKDLEFAVMAKACPIDFLGLQLPPHSGFDKIKGRPLIMEEAIGEFRGKTHIPCVPWKFYRDHIRRLAAQRGEGVVVRLEHNGFPKHNFEHPNEFNVHYISELWANPQADPDKIFQAWFERRYGPKAARLLIPAFKNTEDIWEWSSNSLGVYLNSAHGNLAPIFRGGYNTTANFKFFAKGFGSYPGWAAKIKRLKAPDDATCEEVLAESEKALRLAEESLALVEQAKPHLTAPQYEELRAGFSRLCYVSRIFKGTKQLYLYGVQAKETDDPAVRRQKLSRAADATRELKRVANQLETESDRNAWPIGPDDVRGSNLHAIIKDYWAQMGGMPNGGKKR